MKSFLALSVAANIFFAIILNGVISNRRAYIRADEANWKLVLQLVAMNSAAVTRMRETIANAQAKTFVLCMKKHKSAERCAGKGKV